MAKKYQKNQRQKGVFAYVFYKNKRKTVATSRRFFRRKKATALVTLAWSAYPQHTLVLASHGVYLIY